MCNVPLEVCRAVTCPFPPLWCWKLTISPAPVPPPPSWAFLQQLVRSVRDRKYDGKASTMKVISYQQYSYHHWHQLHKLATFFWFPLSLGKIAANATGPGIQTSWIQILVLPLSTCVTLGKLLNLSLPSFTSLWRLNELICVECEEKWMVPARYSINATHYYCQRKKWRCLGTPVWEVRENKTIAAHLVPSFLLESAYNFRN